MKTHYANVDRGNESNPNDEWSSTACGLEYTESDLTDRWDEVSCKNCLKCKDNLQKHNAYAMEVSIKNMEEFNSLA